MEAFYLILVIVLFGLAISDLIVGVSNDAVNFLNSAIGAKAAPFKIIMIVAALGVLVGATFSSGLMEVARKTLGVEALPTLFPEFIHAVVTLDFSGTVAFVFPDHMAFNS